MSNYKANLTALKKLQAAKKLPEKTELSLVSDNSGDCPTTLQKDSSSNSDNSGAKSTVLIKTCPFERLLSSGLEVLPDDIKWLRNILFFMPNDRKCGLLNEYQLRWFEAMTDDQPAHTRQNKGRFTANTWIRLAISKRGKK